MGLIPRQNAPTNVVPFSMKDIEQAARQMLLRARAQADQILTAAKAEGEALKQAMQAQGLAEGRKQGHAEGLAEGQKQGFEKALTENRQQLADLIATLSNALQEIDASRQELESQALREVVVLALAIARRVTKRQCAVDPAVLEANLAEAMRLVVQGYDLRIVVHPSQKESLEQALPRLALEWPALQHATIVGDDAIAVGGCRVHTAHGEIDADIDAQLDRVIAEVLPDP